MRKQINNAFKNANVNITMAIIAKKITGSNNIIIKTFEKSYADDLIKRQHKGGHRIGSEAIFYFRSDGSFEK